jgi:hypothetical protein
MGHKTEEGLEVDGFDLKTGQMLAVAFGFVETFAALEFEIDDLLGAVLVNDLGGDGGSGNQRSTNAAVALRSIEKHLIKGDGAAHLRVEKLDVEFEAFGNAVLFAAGFDDCESHNPETGKKETPQLGMSRAGGPGDFHTLCVHASDFCGF